MAIKKIQCQDCNRIVEIDEDCDFQNDFCLECEGSFEEIEEEEIEENNEDFLDCMFPVEPIHSAREEELVSLTTDNTNKLDPEQKSRFD